MIELFSLGNLTLSIHFIRHPFVVHRNILIKSSQNSPNSDNHSALFPILSHHERIVRYIYIDVCIGIYGVKATPLDIQIIIFIKLNFKTQHPELSPYLTLSVKPADQYALLRATSFDMYTSPL